MATLQDVEQFIEQNPDICDVGRPAPPELIDQAERFLGVQFPEEYRAFLRTWGTLSIGPLEFYGICSDDLINPTVPNGIGYTNQQRQEGLPKELVMLYDNNGDECYCLDTSDLTRSRVVVWDVGEREVVAVKSDSLFEFILE